MDLIILVNLGQLWYIVISLVHHSDLTELLKGTLRRRLIIMKEVGLMKSLVDGRQGNIKLMEGKLFELQERFRSISCPPTKGDSRIC